MPNDVSLRIITCTVDGAYADKPLRELICKHLKISAKTLARLKRREDGIKVNGERVTVRYILRCGDLVTLTLGEEPERDADGARIVPCDIPVKIAYEDEDIVVVDKPPFMPTHPSHGHYGDTLANALAYRYLGEGRDGFVFRSVNRLDRNTSGLVAVAKNKYAASIMCSSMSEGRIKKTYYAILDGIPSEPRGRIITYIRRKNEGIIERVVCDENDAGALRAVTEYEVVASGADRSLVKLMPRTGRTHQLRVHMAYIGCPITGDGIYGKDSEDIARHALHAASLEFENISGRPIKVSSELPNDMKKLLELYGIRLESEIKTTKSGGSI